MPQGVQCSPSKRKGYDSGKFQTFAKVTPNGGRGFQKISAKKARQELPSLDISVQDLEMELRETLQSRREQISKRKRGETEGLHAFQYDYGSGLEGFDDMEGFPEHNDNDQRDWVDEEENADETDSLETMRPETIEAEFPGTNLGRKGGRKGVKSSRTYAHKAKKYKENWQGFVECVTRQLAFESIGPSTPVCQCSKKKELPIVSFTGINSFNPYCNRLTLPF